MAKTDSLDQHAALHGFWPNNCCLCNAEARIAELERKLAAEQLAEADIAGLERWKKAAIEVMNSEGIYSEECIEATAVMLEDAAAHGDAA